MSTRRIVRSEDKARRIEQERIRALIEEIKRTRIGRCRQAGPGTTIKELIQAGRKY